jgi:signal transduction histidine kinase
MTDMIDGLLSFAKAGAPAAGEARASVRDVLDVLHAAITPVLEAERVAFSLEVEPDLLVRARAGVFNSIAQNLVRNAIAHLGDAPRREVQVRVRSVSPQALELEVADSGPGIPEDVKRRLFKPFERGSTSAAGYGLGLATVKRLVDGHGGSITLETDLGHGTTFLVRLPRATAADGSP